MSSKGVNSQTEKICSRCQAVFNCGPAQGDERCWCERLPHAPLIADERTDCFCPECLSEAIAKLNQPGPGPAEVLNQPASLPLLKEGQDYYVEGGVMVFTAVYHLKRGYCCDSGCRHCPYEQPVAATEKLPH